ncbi:nucleotidyltransferase domain-containing protein [Rhodospira trueperi]|uniref:nucleotidyltransferase domain-containing protein n=1 Tax=Rhodospira trueperi TaxID=69960 RepID=UPI000B85D5B4|nr:nucleotidyltransferase domain-containing protein [Rhodospira trueperi]
MRSSPALRAACARAVRDPARIEAVVLFGSLARGDFDGLSDADLAVIRREAIPVWP